MAATSRSSTCASRWRRPGDGGFARRQGRARRRRHPRRRARHGGGARRGGRDRLLHRAQHPRAALGVRPAGDDRGDGRAGRPPPAAPGSRSRSTTSSRSRSGSWSSGSTRSGAGSTCSSTTSGAARSCSSGTSRSGSTTSTTGCGLLRLAIDTHLITSHFALPLLIREPGGLVVEMTDGTREYNDENYRVAASTTWRSPAVIRLAFAQSRGARPARVHGGRPDPGLDALGDDARELPGDRGELARRGRGSTRTSPRSPRARGSSGRAVAALAADPDLARRNGGSFSSGGLAREYGFTDVDGSQPDCWRYMVEVQDPGLEADPTGYR